MNTNIWEMILLIHGNLQKKENKHCLVIYNSDNSLEKKKKNLFTWLEGKFFMINKHQTGKNVKKTRSFPYLSSFHIKLNCCTKTVNEFNAF